MTPVVGIQEKPPPVLRPPTTTDPLALTPNGSVPGGSSMRSVLSSARIPAANASTGITINHVRFILSVELTVPFSGTTLIELFAGHYCGAQASLPAEGDPKL